MKNNIEIENKTNVKTQELQNTKNITFENKNLTSLNNFKSNVEFSSQRETSKNKNTNMLSEQNRISNNTSQKFHKEENIEKQAEVIIRDQNTEFTSSNSKYILLKKILNNRNNR